MLETLPQLTIRVIYKAIAHHTITPSSDTYRIRSRLTVAMKQGVIRCIRGLWGGKKGEYSSSPVKDSYSRTLVQSYGTLFDHRRHGHVVRRVSGWIPWDSRLTGLWRRTVGKVGG